MSKVQDPKEAFCEVDLPDGDRIVLFDRLAKGDEFTKLEKARNVYRIDPNGRVKWQIHTDSDDMGHPFTNLSMENGLTAYRWSGFLYAVDLETGSATPLSFEK